MKKKFLDTPLFTVDFHLFNNFIDNLLWNSHLILVVPFWLPVPYTTLLWLSRTDTTSSTVTSGFNDPTRHYSITAVSVRPSVRPTIYLKCPISITSPFLKTLCCQKDKNNIFGFSLKKYFLFYFLIKFLFYNKNIF